MDDQSLVKSVLRGNDQAFDMLIKQHQRLVFHMIQKLTQDQFLVEEIAQEVFIKVYEKLPGFRFNSKLSTWIATIAYRETINKLKKTDKMRYQELDDVNEDRLFKESKSPESELTGSNMAEFLRSQIALLPAHYRNILNLFHIEEMTYPEIVEITGLPEGTVKNYLFRARKLLKERLAPFAEREELL